MLVEMCFHRKYYRLLLLVLIVNDCNATSCCTTVECKERCDCVPTQASTTSHDVTCNATNYNTDVILRGLDPSATQRLTLVIPTKLPDGGSENIDIRSLERLYNLEYFRLTPENDGIYQGFHITYDGNTLANLTVLKHFAINVVIWGQTFRTLVEPAKSLEVLDLSGTKHILYNNVLDTFKGLSSNRNITTILLSNFQIADLEYCVTEIDLSSFLQPLEHCPITNLDLSRNGIIRLKPGLNQYLPMLESLNISQNLLVGNSVGPFTFESLIHKNLKNFDFSNQGLVTEGAIDGMYRNRTLEEEHFQLRGVDHTARNKSPSTGNSVSIKKNVIAREDYSPSCIEHFTKTRGFDIAYMLCNYKDVLCSILGDERNIHFKNFPCDALPVLKDIWNPNCTYNVELPLNPLLDSININVLELGLGGNVGSGNQDEWKNKSMICIGPNKLRKISFAFNKYWIETLQLIESINSLELKGLEFLEEVDIRHNDAALNVTHLLKYLPSIRFIYLRGNRIVLGEDYDICRDSSNVEVLDVSDNKLSTVPVNAVKSCHLLKHLYYDSNQLEDFTVNLTSLNLAFVDLRNNRINYLSDYAQKSITDAFKVQTDNNLPVFNVDLSGNPLSCGCETESIEFIRWLQHNKEHFTGFNQYTCSGRNGKVYVYQVNPDELDTICFGTNLRDVFIGVGLTLSVIFLIMLIVLIYRKRWKILYHIFTFELFVIRKLGMTSSDKYTEHSYKYDLYVSYCADDRFWVHNAFMSVLEDIYGFKLCIHYRDFLAGESIVNNIDKCMAESREIVIIVSKNSLNRPFCEYEMQVAEHEVIQRRKKLMIVVLGELPTLIHNRSMCKMLDMNNHLLWPEDPKGEKVFFLRILRVLYRNEHRGSINAADLNAFADTKAPLPPKRNELNKKIDFPPAGRSTSEISLRDEIKYDPNQSYKDF